MTLTDLTDTNFTFDCEFSGDGVEYFDNTLIATVKDEKYYFSLYECDIECLRENCKRILAATEGFVNEGH